MKMQYQNEATFLKATTSGVFTRHLRHIKDNPTAEACLDVDGFPRPGAA